MPSPSLNPSAPVSQLAKAVLLRSLRELTVQLRRGPGRQGPEPEAIHRLRVRTRRVRAVLDVFEPCLPPALHRKARRALRKLRQAAGQARDWDVFIEALAPPPERASEAAPEGMAEGALLGMALARREEAQQHLREAWQASLKRVSALPQAWDSALGAKGRAAGPTLLELAHHATAERLVALDRVMAGSLSAVLSDPQRLHQARIACKRLRYVLEVVAQTVGPGRVEPTLAALASMQDALGQAHDATVALQRADDLARLMRRHSPGHWPRHQPGLARWRQRQRQKQARACRAFARGWAAWCAQGRLGVSQALEGESPGGASPQVG